MFTFFLSIFLALTSILFRKWCVFRRKKLPPGPIPLPIIGSIHLLGNLPHVALHKLSQKYGSIMSIRLGSTEVVVISSPDSAKLVLGTHDADFASRPQSHVTEYLSYGQKAMAFTAYGPYWRSVRKFCTVELLSVVKVKCFARMRREEIGLILEEIRVCAMKHEVVNASETIGGLIVNITWKMLFGRKSDEITHLRSLIQETSELFGAFNFGDYIPMLASLDLQGLSRRLTSTRKAYDEILDTLINEHEQSADTRFERPDEMDFLDILLSLNTNDKTSIKAILIDMVFGATETSVTSIEWVLSLLIKHPRAMKKLQKQLNDVLGDKKTVDEIDLPKLSYLHMVIKETFRLYPTTPLLVPRESINDVVINGYHIPKKTHVLVNVWAFGRDPKVWSENWDEFLPERFLDREIDVFGHHFELIPFGSGRRGCPGTNLGLLTIGLVVSNLVYSFNWDLPNDMLPVDLDMKEKFGLTMPRANPLLAVPTYRLLREA